MQTGPAGLSFLTGELAALLGAELRGAGDVRLDRIDPIDRAEATSLTFVRDELHAPRLTGCGAGAALVSRSALKASADVTCVLLVVEDADLAMIDLLERVAPKRWAMSGVHARAHVDASAELGKGVALGPGVVVGPGSSIGDNTVVQPGVFIGAGVRVGSDGMIHANCVLTDATVIGDRVILHPGVVLGADGFGYRPAVNDRRLLKVPHVGNVVIGDDVEIGANSTIDRGKLGPTLVGDGSKIDNLVQIGHNCEIGRGCLVCGCCALAGSVIVEDGVTLAGGVGAADGVRIGAGSTVGGRSGVMQDVPVGETWMGYPAQPGRAFFRMTVVMLELTKLFHPIRRLIRSREGDER